MDTTSMVLQLLIVHIIPMTTKFLDLFYTLVFI